MVHRMFTNFYKDHAGADALAPEFVRRVMDEVALAQAARSVAVDQSEQREAPAHTQTATSAGGEEAEAAGNVNVNVNVNVRGQGPAKPRVGSALLQCCNRLCNPGMHAYAPGAGQQHVSGSRVHVY
jgi:hypothetical protein